jgi:NAD(P)H-flavin reductase
MYQIIQAIESDPLDFTGVSLLPFYEAPLDALFEEDLFKMQQNGVISYFPIIESADEMWTQGEGKIRAEFIDSFMPEQEDPDGIILISGKKDMVASTKALLNEMGFKKEQFHEI